MNANSPVRLKGKAMNALRNEVLVRDRMICQECGRMVSDNLPDWHPRKAHMAHIRSKGAGGSDTIENVRLFCGDCHRMEHNPKSVPSKRS